MGGRRITHELSCPECAALKVWRDHIEKCRSCGPDRECKHGARFRKAYTALKWPVEGSLERAVEQRDSAGGPS